MRAGLDVGGTKIDVCLLDEENAIIRSSTFERAETYTGLIDQLKAAIGELPPESLANGLGLGVPGLINTEGCVIAVNNIQYLQENRIAEDLATFIDERVVIANHLQCYALSEATSGLALGHGLTVCLIVGTGVGAGLLFEGRPYLGANRMAGEFGATKIVGNPSHSTFEDIISGATLMRRRLANQSNTILGASEVADYDVSKDKNYMSDLADFLLNIIYWLDPAIILLAGGIGMAEGVAERLKVIVAERMPRAALNTEMRRAFFGILSGVRGAALLTANIENAHLIRRAGAAVVVAPRSIQP